MATTDFGALTNAQKKVWAAEITKEGRDQSFWLSNGFVGRNTADMSRPVQRITELTETERGDRCIMQLVGDLQGDGVASDNKLEDNEEQLVNDEEEIVIDQLRNGVRSKGRMSEQRTVIRFRAQAKDKLSFWLAEKTDELLHLTAAGRAYSLNTDGSTRSASQLTQLAFASSVVAASTNRIKYAGTASSEATLTTSDTMEWNLVVEVCAFAKRKKIKPIRDGGKDHYVLLISTEQARDLKKDTDYQTNVRTAGPRGSSNVLFKNALAVIDGVIIHEHNKVFNTLGLASGSKWGSGDTVDGAQAMLLGSQALGYATIRDAHFEESDNTDYKNRPAMGYGRMMGMLKPQYRSRADGNTTEDFGMVTLKTAAAA
jgi:N4-gp56 family major capsid protein